ncbi:hypothetical protein QE152_g41292 [Popillia japonica]|uniref:Uncharacterized protein n=1 Tax=Popillia japonica TaxID=7064 RepID=A0AAW1H0M7_POPJA
MRERTRRKLGKETTPKNLVETILESRHSWKELHRMISSIMKGYIYCDGSMDVLGDTAKVTRIANDVISTLNRCDINGLASLRAYIPLIVLNFF